MRIEKKNYSREELELLLQDSINNKTLKSGIKHLQHFHNHNRPGRKKCNTKKLWKKKRTHNLYGLSTRDRYDVAKLIRRAIILHDWPHAARLLNVFARSATSKHSLFLIRAFFVILMNHPDVNPSIFADIMRDFTGYVLDEDIGDFITLLFLWSKKGKSYNYCHDTKLKLIRVPEFQLILNYESD